MIKATPQKFCESTTLSGSCIDMLSKQITLDNCIKLLVFADARIIDELKINCLKFITLNLVSFFSEGSKLQEQLIGLPIYLIKDIENFVKEKNVNKFLWLDMTYFEKEINYASLQISNNVNLENCLTKSKCEEKYSKIINMFHDYQEQGNNNEFLRERIVEHTYIFRKSLKR